MISEDNKNQPVISVIVPVYNVSKYLDDCMKSLLAQTYRNLEIILVDDGSTDESGRMCDRWAAQDDRIKVIHQPNGGLSVARNAGLNAVTGQYLMFADSDDVLDPRICQYLFDLHCQHQADIVCSQPAHIFGQEGPKFQIGDKLDVFDSEEAIARTWYQSLYPSAWAKLYDCRVFEKVRFTVGRCFEDIDIIHEVFWNAKRIVEVDSCLYGYVHREGSITTQKFSRRDLDILVIARRMQEFAADKSARLQKAARAYTAAAALRVIMNAPRTGEFDDGCREAHEMLKRCGKQVLCDGNARTKTRAALLLYFYARPLMPVIYRRINRWK